MNVDLSRMLCWKQIVFRTQYATWRDIALMIVKISRLMTMYILCFFSSSSIFELSFSSSSLSFFRLRLLIRSSRSSSNWSRSRLSCSRYSFVVWYFFSQIIHILTMMMTTFLIFKCAFNWILSKNEFETKMMTIMTNVDFFEIERLTQIFRNRLIA
jgi:hypothetical protein